ncbi:STAS domain-containing protein [Thalassobacillus sp. CUG 92003]|uniref:STAS domain-containing protein n=1 Tax=Thalassobacillus sp. CUG 92003 TaxID=2736641 RepID=UPI0015E6854C
MENVKFRNVQEVGESIIQHFESIATQSLETQYTLNDNSVLVQMSLETTKRLVYHIGKVIQSDDHASNGTKTTMQTLSREEGEKALLDQQLISTVVSAIPYITRQLWEHIEEQSDALELSVTDVFYITKTIDPLIGEFVQGYTKVFMEQAEDNFKSFNDKLTQMSVPIIQLFDGVGICPIIGELDEDRAQLLNKKALEESKSLRLNYLILDLSGVALIDTQISRHLMEVIQSLKLMGVEVVMTGLSAEVAMTITSLGIDMSPYAIKQNLQQAVENLPIRPK